MTIEHNVTGASDVGSLSSPWRLAPRGLAVLAGLAVATTGWAQARPADPRGPEDALVEVDAVNPRTLYLKSGTFDTRLTDGRDVARLQRTKRQGERVVLQLDGPATPERLAKLREAGVRVGEYLPANAFVVDIDRADARALAALNFVTWAGPYAAEWKLDPEIGVRAYQTPERRLQAQQGRVSLLVTLFEGEPIAPVIEAIRAIPGAAVGRHELVGGSAQIAATMRFADAVLLVDLPGVSFVEDAPENTERSNSNNRWIVQTNQVNVTPFYTQSIRGEGQIVGVLDSRLDSNHCSFSDVNPIGPSHRKIAAYNTSLGAVSHGTHVSGTVAGDNGIDNDLRGVAYAAKIAFNSTPAQDGTVGSSLDLHYSQGARVHTNSWGDDGTVRYTAQCRAIDNHMYINEDSLVLFAVTNTSLLRTPENAKNVLAVGATQGAGSQEFFCSGGRGPTPDGRRKPEIFAPGCNTVSAASNSGCGTIGQTGTSMACPAVAGAAVLVRQYFIDGFYPTGTRTPANTLSPSSALLKAMLINSAADMTGIAGYPSDQEGWGRVTADRAAFFAGDARALVVRDVRNINGLSTGGAVTVGLNVTSSSEPLKITLAFTEPPAAVNAGFATVNDLDLEVFAPGGLVYRGNVFAAGQSVADGARDERNNVEQVILNAPATGSYLVRVSGAAVNVGTQGYAIVATGALSEGSRPLSIAVSATPSVLTPGDPAPFPSAVTIDQGDDALVPGSALLFYRYAPGPFASVPLTPLGGTQYQATLPSPGCASVPEFYISAAGVTTGTITRPSTAPASVFTSIVGAFTTVQTYDMESAAGWTSGAPGDTATAGTWTRVDPVGSDAQPEDDVTANPGVNCWVTGQGAVGGQVGAADLDGGQTTLTSPLINMGTLVNPTVSYWRWFHNSAGSSPTEDSFAIQISNNDGASWFPVETVGPFGPGTGGGWVNYRFRVGTIIPHTPTMRLRFVASDLGGGSIVEAGIDDVSILDFTCTAPPFCLGDADNNGLVNFADITSVLTNFGGAGPLGDADNNGTVNFADVTTVLTNFNIPCP